MNLKGTKTLIETVASIISTHNKERQGSAFGFNVFSILGLESDEVRLHSAFLAKLLDPASEHGAGDLPLKKFLNIIDSALDFSQNTKVFCELYAGDLGRIDIVILDDKNLLIIENKIYALEQKNQLGRYDQFAKKSSKKYEIYYLTLLGNDSQENKELDGYKKISYAKDILSWLNNLDLPQIPNILATQYADTIRKLTYQNKKELDLEIEQLLTNKEALMCADALQKALPSIKADIEIKFWKELYDTIKNEIGHYSFKMSGNHPWNFDEEDKEYIMDTRRTSSGCVQMIFCRQIADENILEFYIEQVTGLPLNFAVVLTDANNNRKKDSTISKICKEIGLNRVNKEAAWEYNSQNIQIYNDGLYDLIDNKNRSQIVENIARESLIYIQNLNKKIYY